MCEELDIAILNTYSDEDLRESFSLEQIKDFLLVLGAYRVDMHSNYLIAPTICHNPIDEEASMKLYYYDESKLFHCYTECSDSFNIFEFYRRYMEVNCYPISYRDSVEYVRNYIAGNNFTTHEEYTKVKRRVEPKRQNFVELPEYNANVLDCFDSHYYHPIWLREHISAEAMKQFNIRFSYGQNKIVIPHYDIDGRLVGIRARAIEQEDIEFGKYMPIRIGETIYNHQLSFNLYGLYENKDMIRKTKTAVIFEGEKSVLLSNSYFGDRSIAVATCGSQLNRFQINLLVKKLGVNNIILAYDKEYKDLRDPKSVSYKNALKEKCEKYQGLAQFFYLYDMKDLLDEKDSPIDKGIQVYQELLKSKIYVRERE